MSLSITTKLALGFLLAATVPASLATALLIDRNAVGSTERIESHFTSLARARNELLARHTRCLQGTAASLAEARMTRAFLTDLEARPRSDSPLGEPLEDLFHTTQTQTWGDTHYVFLVDASGEVVLSPPNGDYERPCRAPHESSAMLRAQLGTHLGDRMEHHAFFDEALAGPTITPFSSFQERDHYHQLVLHPVEAEDGRALGFVAVEVAIDSVIALLSEGFDVGPGGRFTLATSDGTGVVHLKDEEPRELDSPGLAEAIRSEEEVFGEYELADGTRVFGCYLPSDVYPWTVCIEIEREAALASVFAARDSSVHAMALSSLVLALLGGLVGLRFGRPLRRCAEAARRVGDGELDHPIAITRGDDEIGTLERAVVAMRDRLKDQIDLLDERVEERTQQLERALVTVRETKERFELSVEGSRDGIWDWDKRSDAIHFSPRWREMLGLEDWSGSALEDWVALVEPADRALFETEVQRHLDGASEHLDVEVRMRHADGSQRWMLCRALAQRDDEGRVVRVSGSLTDTTEVRRITEELHTLAHHDRLTGLANRVLFTEALEQEIDRVAERGGPGFAVLFFDFDRFKVINDSLGHDAGDAVLLQIAERFEATLGPNDLAARFGGDEFVVLLRFTSDDEEVERACTRFLDVMAEPYQVAGNEVSSTASIGFVVHRAGRVRSEDLIRDADAAMYQAKAAGKARYRAFDESMHLAAVHQLRIEQCLRQADFDSELRLQYQPIIALGTGEIEGFEALVRWASPELGLVRPDQFISIAEETGLIVPMGEWVLRTAAAQLVEWQAARPGRDTLFVNVNVSGRQLTHESFLPLLEEVQREYDFAARTLKVEITETTVVGSGDDAVATMERVRELGFPLAMDDFGTGYSSLSCLHSFPLDVLKVDKSFVQNLEENRQFSGVVQSIVSLAHHLGLTVVAEGVETPGQLVQLEVMGCESVQGYLFSKPLDARDATDFIEKGWRPNSEAA